MEFPPGIASGRIKTVPSQMMSPILMRSCVFRAAEILDGYCLSVQVNHGKNFDSITHVKRQNPTNKTERRQNCLGASCRILSIATYL